MTGAEQTSPASNPLPIVLWTVAALSVTAVLLRFPPAQYSFYPQCPIYHLFGILCPGCGGTRALAALLHGDLSEALRFNAPVTLGLLLAPFGWTLRSRWSHPHPVVIWAAMIAGAVFTVVRNL